MLGWFTTPLSSFPPHTTEQVRGAAEGWMVGGVRLRVAQFLASLARPAGYVVEAIWQACTGLGSLVGRVVGE
jgi:hypothetical protein